MSYNPKQKRLDRTYFQGEYVYNYGGYVPGILLENIIICPNELNIQSEGIFSGLTGTWTRQTSYSGGTFVGGWSSGSFPTYTFHTGSYTGDSQTYSIFGFITGSTYHSLIYWENIPGVSFYQIIYSTGDYFYNGGSVSSVSGLLPIQPPVEDNGVYYVYPTTYFPSSGYEVILSYPSVCPSPTPSITPTQTITPTPTSSSTPTPTPTPSSTPSIPVSDLLYRFDASNSSNLDLRSSGGVDYVEKWRDGSPYGNDIIQSDTTKQPIYQSDGFGSYQVLFDGSNDFLENSSITNIASGITAYTEFMVFRVDDYSGDFRIDSTNGESDSYFDNGSQRFLPLYYPGVRFDNISSWVLQPNYLVWAKKGVVVGDMVGEMNDLPESGVVFDTWAPEPAITNITLGKNYAGGEQFGGALREVIVYKRLLSDIEISNVVSYLKTKWNYSAW